MTARPARDHPLDDLVWNALCSSQSHLAQWGPGGRAGRFDPAISVFGAIEHPDPGAWEDLAQLVGADGVAVFFCRNPPPPPPAWKELVRVPGRQMIAGDVTAVDGEAPVELGPDDRDEMLALAQLTEPGPFLRDTPEMGTYLGIREAGRLVAMAGERMRIPGWTEISAVCTHPDVRAQGHGSRLTRAMVEYIRARGDEALLHVVETNTAAIRLYEALGFERRERVDALVISPPDPGQAPSFRRDSERTG